MSSSSFTSGVFLRVRMVSGVGEVASRSPCSSVAHVAAGFVLAVWMVGCGLVFSWVQFVWAGS